MQNRDGQIVPQEIDGVTCSRMDWGLHSRDLAYFSFCRDSARIEEES